MHLIISTAKRGPLLRHLLGRSNGAEKAHNANLQRPTRPKLVKTYAKVKIHGTPHERPITLRRTRDISCSRSSAERDKIFTKTIKGRQKLSFQRVVGKGASAETNAAENTIPRKSPPKSIYGGVNMKSWIRVLTTPAADMAGTAIILHFDSKRYLIGNISEGTQRACVQLGVPMSKVSDIFLTGTISWGTTGGLVGMILTLADVVASSTAAKAESQAAKKNRDGDVYYDEPQQLGLHGGRNLTHMLATNRKFVFRKGMPIKVHEIKEKRKEKRHTDRPPTWTDQNIRVWAMAIQPDSSLRSHGESRDDGARTQLEPLNTDLAGTQEEKVDLDDEIRRNVVGHMFGSDWELDSLKEMKLKDVSQPMDIPIFIRNSEGGIEKYKGVLPGGDEAVPDIDVLVRTPWPGATISSLPSTTSSNEAMSYIIKGKPQRGKFNAKEAIRLGVKPGPDFQKLTLGENVTNKDGVIVSPDMVLAPTREGAGVAVVELPNRSYINPLLNRPEWLSEDVMRGIGGVIWILGKGVSSDERLQSFMNKFHHLRHLISSVDLCSDRLVYSSAATVALKLNLLDSKFFPIPAQQSKVCFPEKSQPEAFTVAEPGMVFELEPKFNFRGDETLADLDRVQAVADMDQEVVRLATEGCIAYEKSNSEPQTAVGREEILCKDAEVITLGTGSALPSKYRNVSATLVRVPGYGNYLLDCGENTLGQLRRVFGTELPQILRDLKVIWISHLHADHHLGTTSLVKAWHEETLEGHEIASNKLIVASDDGMLEWLTEYSQVENYGFDRLFLAPINQSNKYQHNFSESESTIYGLSSIKACRVTHCRGALAVVFTFPNGFKIAYSGDCLPSLNFATLGRGATLLIHEATFDDVLAKDAQAKKHSTTSGALWVGREMGARRILLTHFSQRYQKIPLMVEAEEEDVQGSKARGKSPSRKRRKTEDVEVIVGFDYMRCTLNDFGRMAALRPALTKLFEDKSSVEAAAREEVSTVAAVVA